MFSAVPRSKVKYVAKMLKAIHAQESKKAAMEKARAVIAELKEKLNPERMVQIPHCEIGPPACAVGKPISSATFVQFLDERKIGSGCSASLLFPESRP